MRETRSYWDQVWQRRLSRRRALSLAARTGIGLAGLSLLGCAPAAPGGTQAAKVPERVTVAYGSDLRTPDPHLEGGITGVGVRDHVYDGLFKMGVNLDVIPGLAVSHKWLGDGRTWEVKLRKGVKFQNGEPFTGEVVKFNTQRQQDAAFKPNYMSDFTDIEKVEVVDDYTVRVISKEPDPTIPFKYLQSTVVPMKHNQGPRGNKAQAEEPFGTGPYKWVKWVKDDRIELEMNEGWWGWQKGERWEKALKIPKIVFRPIPQPAARLAGLKTGEFDIIYGPLPEAFEELKASAELGLLSVKGSGTPMIKISQFDKASPLRDRRVRQAMNYAVDVDTIIKQIMKGYAERNASAMGSAYFGFDKDLKPYTYDPKKAKELLAQAGYPNGFEVVFDTTGSCYAETKEYTQAIAGYLADVGIKAKLTPHAAAANFAQTAWEKKEGPYGLIEACRGTSSLDVDIIVSQELNSQSNKNYSYYANPEADKLLGEGRSTVDPEKRKAIYKKLLALIKEDAPWIFLFQIPYNWAYNKKKLPDFHPVQWGAHLYNYGPGVNA
ncbi:MAG: hypothetical protein HYU86_00135 [Chloroflexi bacterium]|nr:hypothetical protein [Chloroflexota bacterium]